MNDLIIKSANQGGVVFWEEVARDGAQSKTILSGKQRIEIANQHADLFNGNAKNHLIYAAGFPTAGINEFKAVEEMANNFDACYLATHGRPSRGDMDIALEAIKNAKYGRGTFLLPTTEEKSNTILKCNLDSAFTTGIDLLKYVKDKNADIPVDIALVDCPMADPFRVSEFINLATIEGLSIAKICDSRGMFYPNQVEQFFYDLKNNISDKVTLGIHFHNDLGLAMWNTLQVLKQGVRITASSWLGLGERAGLVPTEQILFLLFHERHLLSERLGIENPEKLFTQNIETKGIVKIAKHISEQLEIPIKSTDPIIGSGLISISTGLPFTNPRQFQPFDPKEILGLEQEVVVTHMASKKVVSNVASKMGYEFDDIELDKILTIIKNTPYDSKKPTFEKNELTEIFYSITKKQPHLQLKK